MRKVSVCFFACLMLLLGAPSFVCANPFVVQVPIDATAASPKAAKEKALIKGRRDAFLKIVRNLVPSESRDLFSSINDKELEALTLGTAFEGEKHSKTRYLATAHFRFDERALGRFLKEQGITYADSKMPPQLLIPLLTTSAGAELWQEDNLWLNAWPLGDDLHEGSVSVRLPLGDLQDRALFPISEVQNRSIEGENIRTALTRYNVAGLFIAHLKNKASGAKVALYHFQSGAGWHKVGQVEFSQQSPKLLFKEAKKEVLSLANQWAQKNISVAGTQKKITLLVPITSLPQWQRFQTMLQRLPSIERFQLQSISTTSAQLEISPRGQQDFLRRTLAEEGWHILPSSKDSMVLELQPLSFNFQQETDS